MLIDNGRIHSTGSLTNLQANAPWIAKHYEMTAIIKVLFFEKGGSNLQQSVLFCFGIHGFHCEMKCERVLVSKIHDGLFWAVIELHDHSSCFIRKKCHKWCLILLSYCCESNIFDVPICNCDWIRYVNGEVFKDHWIKLFYFSIYASQCLQTLI